MKKVLVLLLVCVVALTCVFAVGCGGNGKETLYVYTNAGFPPYEYVNEYGEVVGVDIDIMQEIGEILGYNVVINDIEFDLILNEVEKNEFAIGAAGMTQNAERDEIALASISYATSYQYAIVAKGTFTDEDLVDGKLPIAKLAELSNKAIGVQAGTTGNFLIDDAVKGIDEDDGTHIKGDLEGKGSSVVLYTNAIVASSDIGTTVGAVVIDKLPAESICDANEATLECFQLEAEPESYVLYLNKNATALKTKIDKALQSMIDNGVITYFTIKHSGGIVG